MDLIRLCQQAENNKSQFDLNGCNYGIHKRTGLQIGILPHYFFLAAFARVCRAMDILEIGTHEGGSIKAFQRGAMPDCVLVTVDRNRVFKNQDENIIPIAGEAQDLETLMLIQTSIAPPIDILFIDSTHTYAHMKDIFWMYEGVFRPRFIILDDIRINPEMERFWRELSDLLNPDNCFDASKLADREDCGLGIVARRQCD